MLIATKAVQGRLLSFFFSILFHVEQEIGVDISEK